jgi:hypothetical protein
MEATRVHTAFPNISNYLHSLVYNQDGLISYYRRPRRSVILGRTQRREPGLRSSAEARWRDSTKNEELAPSTKSSRTQIPQTVATEGRWPAEAVPELAAAATEAPEQGQLPSPRPHGSWSQDEQQQCLPDRPQPPASSLQQQPQRCRGQTADPRRWPAEAAAVPWSQEQPTAGTPRQGKYQEIVASQKISEMARRFPSLFKDG